MESTMAVSSEKVRALREARSWSQAHLAEAAGLSLRTIQRMETEGTASAESRLAVAAAFSVPVEVLAATPPVPAPPRSDLPATMAPVLLFACTAAASLFELWLGGRLPARVASHFGVTGAANDTMSRDDFVALMVLLTTALPLAIYAFTTWQARRGKVRNLPDADWWLAEPRRQATLAFLHVHFAWLGAGLTALMTWVFWLAVSANLAAPDHPTLPMPLALGGTGVFLALVTAWMAVLMRRFRRGEPRS